MYDDIDGIIDLTPDMSRIWADCLRALREIGDTVLHSACVNLDDIEFTNDSVIIRCRDDALYGLLSKRLSILHMAANSDCIEVVKVEAAKPDEKKVERLEALFGDKLTVVK